jgi:hypothetical protein
MEVGNVESNDQMVTHWAGLWELSKACSDSFLCLCKVFLAPGSRQDICHMRTFKGKEKRTESDSPRFYDLFRREEFWFL